MVKEMNALIHNNTWSFISPKPGMKIIDWKWFFHNKNRADDTLEHHKVRLKAKGYHQPEGSEYGETFSPLGKAVTIQTVLSVAVSYDWLIRQLDFHNAFLNGVLQEDVYMSQPHGFFYLT